MGCMGVEAVTPTNLKLQTIELNNPGGSVHTRESSGSGARTR
jgi:hypothetical protein